MTPFWNWPISVATSSGSVRSKALNVATLCRMNGFGLSGRPCTPIGYVGSGRLSEKCWFDADGPLWHSAQREIDEKKILAPSMAAGDGPPSRFGFRTNEVRL